LKRITLITLHQHLLKTNSVFGVSISCKYLGNSNLRLFPNVGHSVELALHPELIILRPKIRSIFVFAIFIFGQRTHNDADYPLNVVLKNNLANQMHATKSDTVADLTFLVSTLRSCFLRGTPVYD